jgi:uncharacterized protein YggL (DUF469 family)
MNFKPPSPNKRRSRRLRKKLHIGEFKEEGFEVNFRFCAGLTSEEQVEVLMKFITEAIESRALLFGGGENGFVTKSGRGSTTEADRKAVASWLEHNPFIEQVQVGENEDAWYGWVAGDA